MIRFLIVVSLLLVHIYAHADQAEDQLRYLQYQQDNNRAAAYQGMAEGFTHKSDSSLNNLQHMVDNPAPQPFHQTTCYTDAANMTHCSGN